MFSTVTSKGQITLPKALREGLNLQQGDRVEFVEEDDGKYSIVPITTSLANLKGCLPKPEKAVTVEEMNNAIRVRII